ncbi:hypothetical protein COOONC_03795 [Cooperia oncophora]
MRIGIVTVLDKSRSRLKYRTAMQTMECYALRHNYTYKITFRRHCIVAIVLQSFDWILFVDSDMGVVNEDRKLEDYVDSSKDIIFYNRFFNHEIMAGSYLVKRSAFSIRFLRGWADYEFSLPNSFHGRDNGAIHVCLRLLFTYVKTILAQANDG